ncbi:hypothetical protein [Microbulbifer taiwanensis]|uniref:hypothetical protein n=1 Tax=Microbulbifer taiwanensis TaxID=986746 RepID=UPI003618AC12
MEFLSRQSLARVGLDDEVELLETIANLCKHWTTLRDASPAESALDYLASFEDHLEQQRPLLESLDINLEVLKNSAASSARPMRTRYRSRCRSCCVSWLPSARPRTRGIRAWCAGSCTMQKGTGSWFPQTS